ncbi:MAG: hypothetical protein K8M05_05465, partial [Deltaproteobacteria bacterium]|nr:hypothetical protein [Kofleriaceae bacterium]
ICGADHVCDTWADRAEAEGLIEDARLRGNISTVLVGAGLVAGGVGTFLFLRARGKRADAADHAALRVTPIVSADAAALVVGGRF